MTLTESTCTTRRNSTFDQTDTKAARVLEHYQSRAYTQGSLQHILSETNFSLTSEPSSSGISLVMDFGAVYVLSRLQHTHRPQSSQMAALTMFTVYPASI